MRYEYKEVKQRLPVETREAWTIKEVVENTAKFGDEIYLIDAVTGKHYSYEESNTEANKIANSLMSLGLSKGDRVALYMRNKPEYVFSIFACCKAGFIEVPINTNFREPEITHMIKTAEISTVIVDSDKGFLGELAKVSERAPVLKNVLVLGDTSHAPAMLAKVISLDELVAKADASNPKVEVEYSDTCCIFFTSGTTGLPKGAPVSNKHFLLAAKSALAAPITRDDRNYNCLPLFHANNQVYSTMGTRCLGSSYVISDRFSPKKFWREIKENKVTFFNYIGGMLTILDAAFKPEDVPDHGAKLAVGGPNPREGWEEKFKVELFQWYALSEALVVFGDFDPDRSKRRWGSFGVPIFPDLGRVIELVDDEGREVKAGEIGELIEKGEEFTIKGYWGAPEATKEAIDEDGWFHTGDLVRKDEDGYYYYIDRRKFMIRRAGENIATAEVEAAINSHPAVEVSAVFPAPDPFREEEVKAQIILKKGAKVEMEDLIRHCASRLAYHKVPRYIEIVKEFPKTPTERIQKVKLKERERQRKDHGWDRDKEIPNWRERFYGSK